MGLRTELAVDDDRCKECGTELAIEGIALDRYDEIRDGVIETIIGVLCRRCFYITEISYYGELLPSERMKRQLGPVVLNDRVDDVVPFKTRQRQRGSGNEYPPLACVPTVWR